MSHKVHKTAIEHVFYVAVQKFPGIGTPKSAKNASIILKIQIYALLFTLKDFEFFRVNFRTSHFIATFIQVLPTLMPIIMNGFDCCLQLSYSPGNVRSNIALILLSKGIL